MGTFSLGQIITHKQMPELGRLKVEHLTPDHIQVLVEADNGGGFRTFRLPNDDLVVATAQSTAGFEAPRQAKTKTRKTVRRRIAV